MRLKRVLMIAAALLGVARAAAAEDATFQAQIQGDRYVITRGGQQVATYVVRDKAILRPYFTDVHAPDGTLVTRHHPPRPGIDAVDHETMHPGLWLAFGELGGADFWRNKGQVDSQQFKLKVSSDGVVSWEVRPRYLDGDREICTEVVRHNLRSLGDGILLTYHSSFSGETLFAFGDQEEMGLGLRLATPLVVKGGSGTITNSEGGKNEKEVWGQQADWCDYSGIVEKDGTKRRAGMLLIPHKDNFRRSWFHVRDYGLMVANPFGQNAFTKGEKSRIEVKPGEQLHLRFGIWIYSAAADKQPDLGNVAKEYHRLAAER